MGAQITSDYGSPWHGAAGKDRPPVTSNTITSKANSIHRKPEASARSRATSRSRDLGLATGEELGFSRFIPLGRCRRVPTSWIVQV
jgi:hypothetical protein